MTKFLICEIHGSDVDRMDTVTCLMFQSFDAEWSHICKLCSMDQMQTGWREDRLAPKKKIENNLIVWEIQENPSAKEQAHALPTFFLSSSV